MRLVRFAIDGQTRTGLLEGKEIAELGQGAPHAWLPGGIGARHARRWRLAEVTLCAPVVPGKIIGVGLNYPDPAKPLSYARPEMPVCFLRPASCLAGPFDDVRLPTASDTFDYEGELGIVIGRTCRNADDAAARGAIGGYVVLNDLTLRAYAAPATLFFAKCADGSLPCGPCLVTPDELGEARDLRIETTVNGERRQSDTTAHMLHDPVSLVALLSRFMTLEAGDLICTGSPPGSGISRTPPVYLQPGDRVQVSIGGIGAIETRLCA